MKKKYITTSKIKKWKVLDALSALIPAYLSFRFLMASFAEGLEGSTEGLGILLLLCLICSAVVTVPVVVIWRAVSRSMKMNEIKRSTFRAAADLDYYRDKLEGLTPVEISMLTDLEIEAEKDLSAQLLHYELMGVVKMEGDRVELLDWHCPELRQSDLFLLDALGRCGSPSALSPGTILDWKRKAKAEVRNGEWFRSLDPKERSAHPASGCLTGCLIPLVATVAACALMLTLDTDAYFSSFPEEMGNVEFARALARDPELLRQTLVLFFCGGVVMSALFWPVATVIRGLFYVKGRAQTPYVRTARGEELTEYIYGMKNFLHDFSQLSEAEKEHLVLWDDFLIYAVVLEENEQIVRDIFARRGLRLRRFSVL